jgi:hypothetical protein
VVLRTGGNLVQVDQEDKCEIIPEKKSFLTEKEPA